MHAMIAFILTLLLLAKAALASESSTLPICESLDQQAEAGLAQEPPSSCGNARVLFRLTTDASAGWRKSCRDFSKWMEETLRDPVACRSERSYQELLNRRSEELYSWLDIRAEERNLREELDGLLLEGSTKKLGKGEFARQECADAARTNRDFYRMQYDLASRHYTLAEVALKEACADEAPRKEAYLNLVRKGDISLTRIP